MGSLRNIVFNDAVNSSLDRLRSQKGSKYKQKKENRFMTGGVTFEIGTGKLVEGGVQYEISSKIPTEKMTKKGDIKKYFNDVKKIMSGKKVKPVEVKMENIIRSTTINEIKERDYVKCLFFISDDDLFGEAEVAKYLKLASNKKINLDSIKGASTQAGRAAIYASIENTYNHAMQTVSDLIKANETVSNKIK